MKKLLSPFLIVLLVFSVVACSQPADTTVQTTSEQKAETTSEVKTETTKEATTEAATEAKTEEVTKGDKAQTYTPFTVESMGVEVTYDKVPQRVISFNPHTTENLLALGLADKIIARCGWYEVAILPRFQEQYNQIKSLDKKPSFEALLGENPDFVYGRNVYFNDKSIASIESMLENGIVPYVAKASYTEGATMEDTYTDFEVLGKIFKVEDKAKAIVDKMKAQIAEVDNKLKDVSERKKVFVFDSGIDKAYTAGVSLETNIIEYAGGINVFGDEPKTWVEVSWEEVIDKNPDIIVINDYDDMTSEEKIKLLKDNPALSEVNAVKNNQFVVIGLPDIFTGIRNGDAIVYLAENFYPEVFK